MLGRRRRQPGVRSIRPEPVADEEYRAVDSLLSRFDLLFVILDRKDPASDRRISQHVIRSHRLRHRAPSQVGARTTTPDQNDQTTPMFVDPNAAGTGNAPPSAAESGEQLNVAFIKKYIHFAKTRCNPELSAAAAAHISNAYADLRAKARESNGRARSRHARWRPSSGYHRRTPELHGQVTKEDAEAALRVLNYALFAEEHKATVGGSKGGDDNGPSADPAGKRAFGNRGDAAPADEISRDDPRAGIPLESRRRPCLPARPRPPLLPARPRPPSFAPLRATPRSAPDSRSRRVGRWC